MDDWTDDVGAKREREEEKTNVPDVLHLILRPIRIEDGVPGAAFTRRLPRMVRLGRLPVVDCPV